MKFSLPQRPWHDLGWMEIDLPDDWDVQYCPMNGYDNPPLTVEEMAACIERPMGTPPLSELARGKAAGRDRLRRHDPPHPDL